MKALRGIKILANLNTMTFSGLQIMLFALVPFIAERSQLSLSSVVASFSAGSFLFLWASPYWSAKSDSWGRLPVLFIGVIGLALSTGLLILTITEQFSASSQVLLWSSRILYGLTASSVVPVAQALQIDLAAEAAPMKALLANSMSLNAGRALGPLYILIGAGTVSLSWILYGAFWWTLVLAFFNLILVKTVSPLQKENFFEEPLSWISSFAKMRSLFSLAILFTSFIGVLNFSLAVMVQKSFALDSTQSGLLMAQLLLVSAALAFATQALGKMFFKNPWQGALILGSASLLVGTILIGNLNSDVALWTAILFLSIGISLLPPSYLTLMALRNSETLGLGKRAGMMGAANTLGYAFGGALAAWTFKLDSKIEIVLLILGVLISLNVFVLYRTRESEVAHA